MKVISWIIRLFLFLVALGFALANQEPTTLRFLGIADVWRAPLVVFLLIFFAAGIAFGLMSLVPTWFRQRRELGRLRKELNLANKAAASAAVAPVPDAPSAAAIAAAGAHPTS